MRTIAMLLLLAGVASADKPTKMSQAQGDALYRIHHKLDELLAERNAILKVLEIDPKELGKTVAYDFETLAIQRIPEPAKQKAAGGK